MSHFTTVILAPIVIVNRGLPALVYSVVCDAEFVWLPDFFSSKAISL